MVCEKKHKNEWVRRNGMWGRGVGNKIVKKRAWSVFSI